MKIGWIGFHVEGIPALRGICEQGVPVEAVISLKQDSASKRSGAADYESLCHELNLPLYTIDNINDNSSLDLLRKLSLDLAFVIGWSQIVRPEALNLARVGMIGAHASLLPHHRGRAPINWALIKGAKRTGNSLIWLAKDIDSGDIIDQTPIDITDYDTCASLYEKVGQSNKEMILGVLPKLLQGERPGKPQQTAEPPLPGRRPQDGLINWSGSSTEVYDFVRALTRPYPGAFSWLDGKRWTVWHCAILPGNCFPSVAHGENIGPVRSPVDSACGQAIACGKGAVVLLELEGENGEMLNGQRLSDQAWEGKVWGNERP